MKPFSAVAVTHNSLEVSMYKAGILVCAVAGLISAATVKWCDNMINRGETVVMSKDDINILMETVVVESSATPIIQAGTEVKSLPQLFAKASGLTISRGAMILAEGAKEEPIIFTTLSDNIGDPHDIDPGLRGLWEGIQIGGYAQIVKGEIWNLTARNIPVVP